jgi:hypothetical protein
VREEQAAAGKFAQHHVEPILRSRVTTPAM